MHPVRDISDVASAVEKLRKRGLIFTSKVNSRTNTGELKIFKFIKMYYSRYKYSTVGKLGSTILNCSILVRVVAASNPACV